MFKFYTIRDEQILQHLIGSKPTIKFSSAFNLNDPNELKFNFKMDPMDPELKERFFIDNPEKTLKDFSDWQSQLNPNFNWYIAQQQRNDIAMSITLSCFTKSYDNNLMWSHYTDNHSGICVEYKPELSEFLRNIPGFFARNDVKYTAEPPEINLAGPKDEAIIWDMIFNKQDEWGYENEYRIVRMSDKDNEFIPFPQELIQRVIIGSKARNTIVDEVFRLCTNTLIEIHFAVNVGRTYKVQVKKHKPGTFYQRSFWK